MFGALLAVEPELLVPKLKLEARLLMMEVEPQVLVQLKQLEQVQPLPQVVLELKLEVELKQYLICLQ